MKTSKLLRIYLQDHDAIAFITTRLIRRTRSSNKNGALADFLDELGAEAERDLLSLQVVMQRLDVRPKRTKRTAVWIAEKAGLAKLNGRWIRYSDLSRLFELEGLALLVTMNLSLWESLDSQLRGDSRLDGIDFGPLIQRDRGTLETLRTHRRDAAGRVFRHQA